MGPEVAVPPHEVAVPRRRYRRRIRKLRIKVALPERIPRVHRPVLKLGLIGRGDCPQRLELPSCFHTAFTQESAAYEVESDSDEEDMFSRVVPNISKLQHRQYRGTMSVPSVVYERRERVSQRRREQEARSRNDSMRHLDRKYSNAEEELVLYVRLERPVVTDSPNHQSEHQSFTSSNQIPLQTSRESFQWNQPTSFSGGFDKRTEATQYFK